jgi:hypothetical protein
LLLIARHRALFDPVRIAASAKNMYAAVQNFKHFSAPQQFICETVQNQAFDFSIT